MAKLKIGKAEFFDDLGCSTKGCRRIAVVGALAGMEKAGATITVASDESRQTWADNMENAALVWATELDAQGKPALEILTKYISGAIDAGASPLRNWAEE